jgi:hypothetical protein
MGLSCSLTVFALLWLSVDNAAAEPQPVEGGFRAAALGLGNRLNEIGITLDLSLQDAPSPNYVCAEKWRSQLAFEPAHPSTLVWIRCVPADCSDIAQLPAECWRRAFDGGSSEIGYARDNVKIAGHQSIEFGNSGPQGEGPDLISLERVQLGANREGLLISTKVPGTNHSLLQCLLTHNNGAFRCLETPGLDDRVKTVTPVGIDHLEILGMTLTSGEHLIRYGVYFPGDPNCCPCAFIEAKVRPKPDAIHVSSVKLLPNKTEEGCADKLERTRGRPH